MNGILTIGYEGSNIDDFIATLLHARVSLLLDVREFPGSRRRGFSKSPLSEALEEKGIGYRHERALGSPKSVRDRLREDGDYGSFFKAYRRHLAKQRSLLESLTIELSGRIALMCYERDWTECHRKEVATTLGKMLDVEPRHLEVTANRNSITRTPQGMHSRQGLSTA